MFLFFQQLHTSWIQQFVKPQSGFTCFQYDRLVLWLQPIWIYLHCSTRRPKITTSITILPVYRSFLTLSSLTRNETWTSLLLLPTVPVVRVKTLLSRWASPELRYTIEFLFCKNARSWDLSPLQILLYYIAWIIYLDWIGFRKDYIGVDKIRHECHQKNHVPTKAISVLWAS